MIQTEIVVDGEEQKIRTFSDANMVIHGGFPEGDYDEAIDPIDSGRTYIETDKPIGWNQGEIDYATVADILTQGAIMITREHAYKLREFIVKASASLSDTDAIQAVELFPRWATDTAYAVGDRASYEGMLYKCLTAHTSQTTWTPPDSPSLWVRVDDPSIEWPEWVQPLGSTDAYPMGAKVSHNGRHWISDYDANIWEPGVYGWTEANA